MKRNLLLLLSLALFAGCSEVAGDLDTDDVGSDNNGGTVTFTNGGIKFTRVTDSQFDTDDKILVKAFEAGSECDDAIYAFADSKFSSTDPIKLPEGGSLSYIAVYPSTATLSGTFETKADQSSAESYEQSDLLIAALAESTSTTPKLTFSHVLSSIIFNVKVREDGVAKSDATVKAIFKLKNQATIDAEAMSYEATGQATEITPYPSVGNGSSDAFNYSLVTVPQAIAANETIATVTVNGTDEFCFVQPTDLTLLSSKQHSFTFTVDVATKETSIEFGGVIDNWESVTPTEPAAIIKLADISETNYPAKINNWIITDSSVSEADASIFSGLNLALGAIDRSDSTRMISLSFPNLTTPIPAQLFMSISSLYSITAPLVPSTGQVAFSSCVNLTTVNMPQATSISEGSFYNCINLTTVNMPQVASIGERAFDNCSQLVTCNILKPAIIHTKAFNNCVKLQSIDLSKVTSIEPNTFTNCKGLKEVNLSQVTRVGTAAFAACENLSKIDLPKATTIGDNSFRDCANITEINIPVIDSIGVGTIQGCRNLRSIDLSNVPLSAGMFALCYKLTDIKYNTDLYTISDGILYDKAMKTAISAVPASLSTTSLSLPSTTTTIANFAFMGCEQLTSIDLPNITIIPHLSFQDCTGIKSVSLPKAEIIQPYAFRNCINLASISLPEATSLESGAFDGCKKLATVDIPKVVSLGSFCFKDCTGLSSFSMATAANTKIKNISSLSFLDCLTQNVTLTVGAANSEFVDGNTLTTTAYGGSSNTFKEIIIKQ